MTGRCRLLLAIPLWFLCVANAAIASPAEEPDWLTFRGTVKSDWILQCKDGDGKPVPVDIESPVLFFSNGEIGGSYATGLTAGGNYHSLWPTGRITAAGTASGQAQYAWGKFSWDGTFSRDGQRIRGSGSLKAIELYPRGYSCGGTWKADSIDDSPSLKVKFTTPIPKLKHIAPGMDGVFEVHVTNSGTQPVSGATLSVSTKGKILSLLYVLKGDKLRDDVNLEVPPLNPGQTLVLKENVLFRAGNEDVPEIFERVIKARDGSISLDQSLQVRLEVRENAISKSEYNIPPEIVYTDGTTPKIEYPDFANIVGVAGPVFTGETVSASEAAYNLKGDPGWSDRNNPEVRRLAIRAARYDDFTLTLREFPASARQVAYNMKAFIYHLLNPKSASRFNPLRTDVDIATQVDNGALQPQTPGSEYRPNGYICMEHAFLMTSLLRTLGIPAKEANAFLSDKGILYEKRYQTAAAMAWIEALPGGFRWQYLDPYMNIDSPLDYDKAFTVYAWYGVQSAPTKTFPITYYATTNRGSVPIPGTSQTLPEGNRFGIPDVEMDGWLLYKQSPLWKRLYPTNSDPNVSTAATTITVHSPVRLAYRDSSGKTTGVINAMNPVAEIPNSRFLPAGASIFVNAQAPPITIADDVIVLPSNGAADSVQGHLLLTGTGNGSYTIDVQQQTRDQSRALLSQQGTVTQGQVIDYDLQVTTSANGPRAVLRNPDRSAPADPGFDQWKFDEAAGAIANNATRPARGGLLVNGPTWAMGKIAGAVRFNGGDGYVNVPAAIPSPGSEGTIIFWFSLPIELSGITSLHGTAIEGLAKDGPEGGHLVVGFNQSTVYSGSYAMEFGINNGRDWAYMKSSTERWSANTWYHVAVSWGSGGMKMYVNGALQSANSDQRTPAAFGSNFRIGQNSSFKANGQGGSWNGLIDDVRVYSRAISDAEVKAIYAQQ